MSDRSATSAAAICIWLQNSFASAIVAPYTTRSKPAHNAFAMHIGQGSHVVYIVYPFSEAFFSFLHASLTVRTSACELGSFSLPTAFNPRISRPPVFVSTISAANGTGRAVSIVFAAHATNARILSPSSSIARCRFFSDTFIAIHKT